MIQKIVAKEQVPAVRKEDSVKLDKLQKEIAVVNEMVCDRKLSYFLCENILLY